MRLGMPAGAGLAGAGHAGHRAKYPLTVCHSGTACERAQVRHILKKEKFPGISELQVGTVVHRMYAHVLLEGQPRLLAGSE